MFKPFALCFDEIEHLVELCLGSHRVVDRFSGVGCLNNPGDFRYYRRCARMSWGCSASRLARWRVALQDYLCRRGVEV